MNLFIFTRDLRVNDNIGLNKIKGIIIPLFILTPKQISTENKLRSKRSIKFMLESIESLNEELDGNLILKYGEEIDVLEDIYNKYKFISINYSKDYTPYALQREKKFKKFCKKYNIELNGYDNHPLIGEKIHTLKTTTNIYYKIFGSFYKKALTIYVDEPKTKKMNYMKSNSFKEFKNIWKEFKDINNIFKGGRKEAIKRLNKKINYDSNDMTETRTTLLSPYIKYGLLSIREVYKKNKNNVKLIRQLYWRDFYMYVCLHYPELFKYEPLGNKIIPKWNNPEKIKKWKKGKTGFPIVDAGMRELLETGYMNNRARLIASSFLVKDLLINWSLGEKWFTQKLIDIDRCLNLGNWNWSANFGLDHSQFSTIINPWSQTLKYDPECIYIKKWIPELKNIENKIILKWYKYNTSKINYPKPIVDHSIQRKIYLKRININKDN